MPIAKIQLEDGRVAKFEVPDGTTPEEAVKLATEYFKEKPQPNLMSPVKQALTFGFADELGGVGARIGAGLAGANAGRRDQVAQQETQRQRNELAATREAYPVGATALEIGASIPYGLATGGLATTGPRLAGMGIAEGALYGVGSAEENKLLGGLLGGAFGGIMSGVVPAVTHGGSWLGRKAKEIASPYYQRMTQQPQTRAGQIIGQQLQAGGVTPAQLRSRAKQLGPDATLAEVAGPPGVSLGQGVIDKDMTGKARLMAERNFNSRLPGMSGRVRQDLQKATGVKGRLLDSLDEVRARQVETSGPLYQEAYSQEIPLTDKLKNILNRKVMKSAFSSAKESAETVGDELPPWFKMDDLGEWEKVGEMPDMRAWDRMKQGIDRLINQETDSVTGRLSPKGRDLVILKNQLLDELDQINPTYKAARQAFSGDAAIEKAMRDGERFLNMKTRDVHQAVRNMSDSERESFLVGAMEAMREKVGRARSGDMGSFKFLEQDNVQEKLRALFPQGREGDKLLAGLMRDINRERVLKETTTALVGGSQTQLRKAAGDVLDASASMPTAPEIMASPVRAGAQRAGAEIMQAMAKERQPTIDALAKMLFESGNVEMAITELQKRGVPQEVIQQYLNAFTRGSAAMAPAAGLLGGNIAQ